MYDKVVNNLVSKYILEPALIPCLINTNIASRKGMGTKKGLELRKKFDRSFNSKYYILKCDISKYFASIDKDILKAKINRKIKDKDAINIINEILDSYDNGLCIGSNTSQILAIFYLNDLDHYIKEDTVKFVFRRDICQLHRGRWCQACRSQCTWPLSQGHSQVQSLGNCRVGHSSRSLISSC